MLLTIGVGESVEPPFQSLLNNQTGESLSVRRITLTKYKAIYLVRRRRDPLAPWNEFDDWEAYSTDHYVSAGKNGPTIYVND